MNKKKKVLINVLLVLIIIVVLVQVSLYISGQIVIPNSKNPLEQTYSISTIVRPYLLHGKPDEIDNSLKGVTGEKILVYKNVKIGSYGNVNIKYCISESNTLHYVDYYFIDGFEQSNMIENFKSKLSSKYEETEEKNNDGTTHIFSINNSVTSEFIYISENNQIIIEYFR